ncbi:MAG: Uncharacterised protein [Rhodospirillaceae bacterium]|nr:MAG: Uncharacterised protein [Rhodospirillaceae bacterium]
MEYQRLHLVRIKAQRPIQVGDRSFKVTEAGACQSTVDPVSRLPRHQLQRPAVGAYRRIIATRAVKQLTGQRQKFSLVRRPPHPVKTAQLNQHIGSLPRLTGAVGRDRHAVLGVGRPGIARVQPLARVVPACNRVRLRLREAIDEGAPKILWHLGRVEAARHTRPQQRQAQGQGCDQPATQRRQILA